MTSADPIEGRGSTAATVLIAGYYGFGNTGDEAILAAILADLRELRPDLDCVVVTGDPAETAARHGVRAVLWTDLPAILDAAQRADLIVLGGGGVFHDYWGAQPESLLTSHHGGIPYYSGFAFLATLTNRPCLLYAVGVGPLFSEEAKALTRLAFEHATAATVRDPESRDLLLQLGVAAAGVSVTADPAFRLPPGRPTVTAEAPASGPATRRDGPVVGVCLRNWDIDVWPEAWQPPVATALDRFVERHGGALVFVPFQTRAGDPLTDDLAVAHAVVGRLRNPRAASIVEGAHRPEDVAGILAQCDLVVGMRLHSLIFALRGGVPAVALVYDPKVGHLMARIGLARYALDLPTLTASGLEAALEDAWTRRHEIRRELAAPVATLTEQAGESARLAIGLLDRPFHPAHDPAIVDSIRRYALTRTRALALHEQALAERDRQIDVLSRQVAATGSAAWALVDDLRRLALAVAPLGSRRRRVLRSGLRTLAALRDDGAAGFAAAARAELTKALRVGVHWLAQPRGVFADRYAEENNRQVTLYTDDADLFPLYQPRRSLVNRKKNAVVVSLIATARNEGQNARLWFADLMNQTRLPDEVVVVDGGSTDGTLELLWSLARHSPIPFLVLSEPGGNIARGRNLAIARARGPVIASTDFGCRLPSTWLERLIAPFEDEPETQVVAGWYEAVSGGRPLDRRWWASFRSITPDTFLPSSRSIAFTKSAWERAGRYPEWLTLTGEDTYLALELQRYCPAWAFVPDATVQWEAPATLTAYWRKIYGWTMGDGESGVHSRYYWRSFLCLTAGLVAFLGAAAALWGLARGVSPAWCAALLAAAGLPAVVLLRRGRWHTVRRPIHELGAEIAAVAGFVRGAARRQAVAARRAREVRGVFFILSGVPIDDTGGGARCTQMALELLRQRFAVVFLNRFPKHESTELHLDIRHPNLMVHPLAAFDWAGFQATHPTLVREKPLAALVEFPLADFLPLVSALREHRAVVVYDLLDDWQTTLGADWYSPAIERRIVAASHVLVATAGSLAARLQRLSGRPVTLLPNAVNARLFDRHRVHVRPPDLPRAQWTITYTGALWGSWFDWELLVAVARAYPDAAVVVIGDYRGQCAHAPQNVHFLGLRAQRELPAYLANTTVAILPWKVDTVTRATSPLKVYEYVAMGRPVVAPDLPTLADVPFVLRSADRAEFVGNVARARGVRVEGDALEAFVRANSWEARVDRLVKLVAEAPAAARAPAS